MDGIAIFTAIGYLFMFSLCWYVLYRIMNRFLGILMPWVLKASSGVLAALFVWRFCSVHVSF